LRGAAHEQRRQQNKLFHSSLSASMIASRSRSNCFQQRTQRQFSG
jgi:hypothetical protein